jgi:diguanylate cyclase (GGDEF)-like protein
MKKLSLAVVMVLVCVACAAGAEIGTLTTLAAIHRLSNEEASRHLPVEFEATVTYYRDYERTLFVQDGDAAIYIRATTGLKLMPGDRIRVRGTTDKSFRPIIGNSSIERLGHDEMPKAVAADFSDLMHARYDCRLVTVRALVRTADVANFSRRNSRLQMLADGGAIEATLDSNEAEMMKGLLDAEVEVTGVASGRFDGKMQQTGVLLHITSLANIKVLRHAPSSPWSLPVTPMDEILKDYHVVSRTPRVRVQGTITYYHPGSAVVLQNGSKSLWIMTESRNDLRLGDVADATGIPDVHDGFLALTQATVQDTGVPELVTPRESNWSELTQSHHLFDLVSIRGEVVGAVREAAQDEYLLLADGHLFSAIILHPATTYSSLAPPSLPPMKEVPIGSTIQVTGVCVLEDSNPFDANVPFDLMMRSYDDIALIARPSWLSVRNLIGLISLLLVIMLAVSAWGWMLRRKVRRQTVVLAARAEAEAEAERQNARLQQQRSRILEDINGARPLVEVLEEILDFVSFQLHGAPCWCEIADGARLGSHGADTTGARVVEEAIPARTGPPLGTIFAAVYPHTPAEIEHEAFFTGSRLATLAIENRRLYSDLVHRSEFDQLTDIHNRFSLDKQMEAQIARARENATIFGLVYVDLDEFKQVNDQYGHRVGDLYLQEASRRMKRQLRSADLLARIGGDEFAVLVPQVHNRSEVEEIALRLDHCFAAPYSVEGCVLRGTASIGIALYPEDGSTKDSLLSAADAAMYVTKHIKQGEGETAGGRENRAAARRGDNRG